MAVFPAFYSNVRQIESLFTQAFHRFVYAAMGLDWREYENRYFSNDYVNHGRLQWIEGKRYCREYDKVLSGRAECFYVIKEKNGIAWYAEDGAFNDRIRFTTPLSSE